MADHRIDPPRIITSGLKAQWVAVGASKIIDSLDGDSERARGFAYDVLREALPLIEADLRERIAREIETEMADALEDDGDAVTAICIVRGATADTDPAGGDETP